uniref:Protein kinase domain-containing protein n=3 Tax=Mesocestoides corti TaxID=53468 RepID=A0A5K3EPU1_MESCO
MTFIGSLLKKLRSNEEKPKQKSLPSVIVRGVDPSSQWKNCAELGDGAFGKVYKASNIETGQLAALKSVDFSSEEELEDLMVEIEILCEYKHPNILQLQEAYIFDKKLWMYLEFCGGGAVDNIMKVLDKPLTEPQIKFISREVICGLEFLHRNLIIHRDLKAGNILITLNNEIRLADFGVSARMESESQKRTTFIGTPYWMAPEVIACETFKDNPYDMAADVWSFGITLIEFGEMLPPYNDLNPTRVLLKITKSEPPKFSRPKDWSPSLNNLVRRCLQKSPEQRPTMADLMSDPFVADVTEADRSVIKILLGEVNADVEETVEEVAPEDLPDLDPAMVSADAAEVMAHSLQVLEDVVDDKSSSSADEVALDAVSYEDVEFNLDDAIAYGQPEAPTFIPIDESLSVREKAIRDVANALIHDVLLHDVDFTSLAFVAFESLRDSQEQSESEDAFQEAPLQTSFGPSLPPPPPPIKDNFESPPPTCVPDFASEVVPSSPLETQELSPPRPHSPNHDEPQFLLQLSQLQAPGSDQDGDASQAVGNSAAAVSSALRRCPTQFRTSTRVRRFVVDGEEHTTTSKKVVLADRNARPAEYSVARMRALRDFRELAKESKRRNREIAERVEQQVRQLEAKQATEFTQLHRNLTRELELVAKKYKANRDRLQVQYENDLKALQDANAQAEKAFLDQFKSKLEYTVSSRTLRKSVYREVRDTVCGVASGTPRPTSARERTLASADTSAPIGEYYRDAIAFREAQEASWCADLAQLKAAHEEKLVQLEAQLRTDQYNINLNSTKEQGRMEQRHMHMRHQLARSQLKDFAMADRQLLAKRLASQLLELRETAEAEKERLFAAQALEKKAFLKNEKASRKRRMAIYQKRLRDDGPPNGLSVKEATAKVDEMERMRATEALHLLNKHHQMQLQALDRDLMARFVELDEQQSEKKTQLANQETSRLKELDDEHKLELKAHADRLLRKLVQLSEKYEKYKRDEADSQPPFNAQTPPPNGSHNGHLRKSSETSSMRSHVHSINISNFIHRRTGSGSMFRHSMENLSSLKKSPSPSFQC